jgi:hypothetical protein
MKIGILTFHFAHNYGAMLQAYALQEVLKSQGHDVFIIDYRPLYHSQKFSASITWGSCLSSCPKTFAHNVVKKILSFLYYKKRYSNFDNFITEYMNIAPCGPNFDGADYDYVILGSDQIWNKNLTGGQFDKMYFGVDFKCPVISYAASNQNNKLSDGERADYRNLLQSIKSIGVRELKLKELLQPLTDKTITLTLDPTLIADNRVYTALDTRSPIKEKYVLVYEIAKHTEVVKMARLYARKINAQLICLVGAVTYRTVYGYDLQAGPLQFLSYIKNAECIFTTSFHGTALSIIYKKDFYSVRQGTLGDIRMESLLTQLGLLNRFVSMGETLNINPIDYAPVNRKLDNLRSDSINFLIKSIE